MNNTPSKQSNWGYPSSKSISKETRLSFFEERFNCVVTIRTQQSSVVIQLESRNRHPLKQTEMLIDHTHLPVICILSRNETPAVVPAENYLRKYPCFLSAANILPKPNPTCHKLFLVSKYAISLEQRLDYHSLFFLE